jgi:hypothetical protein
MSTAGLATDTGQNTGNASLASIDTKLSNPLPVSNAVLSTLVVTLGKLQVELPSGGSGLTNAEIRATPLPVSGTVTANTGLTQPITDAQLRATPLPVSFTGGGDATAANQTTEIAKLTSIDGKVPALGQALAAASTPIVLTAAQLATLTPLAQITGFATSANQQTNAITDAQIRATALPISGTVTANTGLTQPLTDTQIRATALAVSGTFFQATQPISGTVTSNATLAAETTKVIGTVNVAGTIPISGALTDTQLRASAVPVTSNAGTNLNTSALNLEATQALIKTNTDKIPALGQALAAASSPVVLTAAQITTLTPQTNALTDAQLRATAVAISGTVTTGGLTDTQIRATALPVSLASVPSHAVTNAGTFAVQATLPVAAITYSAVGTNLVPATAVTDLVTIYGSATKTVTILNIWVTGVQTTAGQASFLLIKRSAANTAGTSTALTRIPYDANDAAATATVLAYTANPTVGTAIGNVRGDRAFLPGAASASDAQGLSWGFLGAKQITLRGTAQGVCINLAGATLAGGSINVTIEWTEA